MKTTQYNPSKLETDFASIIEGLKTQIESQLQGQKIVDVQHRPELDNPDILFVVEDQDQDRHEIVVRFIQRIET